MNDVMTRGFAELSADEMMDVDGGVIGLLAAMAGIAAVGGAAYVCYQCGEAVGKFARNVWDWIF